MFTQEGNAAILQPDGEKYPDMPYLEIHSPGIEKLQRNIKVNKAIGPDELSCLILRALAEDLAPILTYIFNQSLTAGDLPRDWLKAKVAPNFEKGNTHLAENYRPV